MDQSQDFEKRKAAALKAAREQGIIDVVTGAQDGISPETVELAAKLMKKHGSAAYDRLEARRNTKN
ncbi:MAG: hypothetical protein LBT39_01365 [Treponema sp.]|jgi:hypothetical protein|nr:hypothetical protein [Treponema sp.]